MSSVQFDEQDGVAIVTLDRQEKLNALNRAMAAELNAAWRRFFDAAHLRVAVYCANGRAFSAGVDVADAQAALGEAEGGDRKAAARAFDIEFEDAEFCAKPIVAAIQGPCYGFGMTSSMACDIRIAADNAQFCMPEVKLGVASVHGNLRMVQMAGLARTMELLLTGEKRDARWALAAGLINEIVPQERVRERALEVARTIAAMDPRVVHDTRKVGYMSQYASFADTVATGVALRADLKLNQDYVGQIAGAARASGGLR